MPGFRRRGGRWGRDSAYGEMCGSVRFFTTYTYRRVTPYQMGHRMVIGPRLLLFRPAITNGTLVDGVVMFGFPRRVFRRAGTEAFIRILRSRTRPVRLSFGEKSGKPIDRAYIETFMRTHQDDIRGKVLECGDKPDYAVLFGGDRVESKDVLYPFAGLPGGTLVGDLGTGEGIPVDRYDCMILTQVLQFIPDLTGAVVSCHSALREGGVVLATMSAISKIDVDDTDAWDEYWRITPAGARRLFDGVFGADSVEVRAFGNVMTACAFLHGIVVSELDEIDLMKPDPEYPVTVAVRAVKRGPMRR